MHVEINPEQIVKRQYPQQTAFDIKFNFQGMIREQIEFNDKMHSG